MRKEPGQSQFFLWEYSQEHQEHLQENMNSVHNKTWEESGHSCPYFVLSLSHLSSKKLGFPLCEFSQRKGSPLLKEIPYA